MFRALFSKAKTMLDPTGPWRLSPDAFPDPAEDPALPATLGDGTRSIVLGGGCFWCTEAVFKRVRGVTRLRSGYAGGTAETADYKAVCTGTTNHAEVIEVTFDPGQVSLGRLLKLFFSVAHDPTQKDRQGNDVGRQYRSAIFYATPEEKAVAEAYIRQIDSDGLFSKPIQTQLEPLEAFYEAEAYHQDYADRNPSQPYIAAVARPKVEKLKKLHPGDLKA